MLYDKLYRNLKFIMGIFLFHLYKQTFTVLNFVDLLYSLFVTQGIKSSSILNVNLAVTKHKCIGKKYVPRLKY